MNEKKNKKYALLLILAFILCLSLIGISWALYPKGEHVHVRYVQKTSSNALPAIDLNHATLEELMSLPQIGEVRAQNIISYRNEHGLFSSIEEIMDVPGIGPGIFQEIQSYLYI